jgi:hypothetical protein
MEGDKDHHKSNDSAGGISLMAGNDKERTVMMRGPLKLMGTREEGVFERSTITSSTPMRKRPRLFVSPSPSGHYQHQHQRQSVGAHFIALFGVSQETSQIEIRQILGSSSSSPPAVDITNVILKMVHEIQSLFDGTVLNIHEVPEVTRQLCGKNVPHISLSKYLARLVLAFSKVYSTSPPDGDDDDDHISIDLSVGMRCAEVGMAFIERLLKSVPEFNLHAFNVHRVLFISVWTAAILMEDEGIPLHTAAEIAGMDVSQIKSIQTCFCDLMKFRFWIDPRMFEKHSGQR